MNSMRMIFPFILGMSFTHCMDDSIILENVLFPNAGFIELIEVQPENGTEISDINLSFNWDFPASIDHQLGQIMLSKQPLVYDSESDMLLDQQGFFWLFNPGVSLCLEEDGEFLFSKTEVEIPFQCGRGYRSTSEGDWELASGAGIQSDIETQTLYWAYWAFNPSSGQVNISSEVFQFQFVNTFE